MNQTINRYPHVKAARDLADNQEALFIADSFVTTADGDVPVPSGNYNVDGGTAAEPASYWKLWVLELLKEGGISWLKMFNHWFGNSKFAQGDLTVHKYADQKFRVPQLDWASCITEALPDWLIACQFFAGLNSDLQHNVLAEHKAEMIPTTFTTWNYRNLYSWAQICEASPKYKADRERNKKINKISSISLGAITDNTSDGDGAKKKRNNSKQNNKARTRGPWGLAISPADYRSKVDASYNTLSNEQRTALSSKLAKARQSGVRIPAFDGNFYTTTNGKEKLCNDFTGQFKCCGGVGHDVPQCKLNQVAQPWSNESRNTQKRSAAALRAAETQDNSSSLTAADIQALAMALHPAQATPMVPAAPIAAVSAADKMPSTCRT